MKVQVPFAIIKTFFLSAFEISKDRPTAAQWFCPDCLINLFTSPTTYAISGHVDTIAYIDDPQAEALWDSLHFFLFSLSSTQCNFEIFTEDGFTSVI